MDEWLHADRASAIRDLRPIVHDAEDSHQLAYRW
jgi:hypothetical protein